MPCTSPHSPVRGASLPALGGSDRVGRLCRVRACRGGREDGTADPAGSERVHVRPARRLRGSILRRYANDSRSKSLGLMRARRNRQVVPRRREALGPEVPSGPGPSSGVAGRSEPQSDPSRAAVYEPLYHRQQTRGRHGCCGRRVIDGALLRCASSEASVLRGHSLPGKPEVSSHVDAGVCGPRVWHAREPPCG